MERKAKARSNGTKESLTETNRLSPVDKIFLGEDALRQGKYDEKEFVREDDAVSFYTVKRPVTVDTSAPQNPVFFSDLQKEEAEAEPEEKADAAEPVSEIQPEQMKQAQEEKPAQKKQAPVESDPVPKKDLPSKSAKKDISSTDRQTFGLIVSMLVTFFLIILLVIAFIILK